MHLLLLMFCFALCNGEQNKLGAVILTGKDGHAAGFEMEAELLKKGYDVHLVQVKTENMIYEMHNWSQTKLGQQLQDKHYEKLIFIVDGHGNKTAALYMSWKNIFNLIQLLETKANELLIHLQTCHSGDVVQEWMDNFGQKVKIFSTLSCRNEMGVAWVRKHSFGQLITGNWSYSSQRDHVDIEKFKHLDCNATYEELAKAVDSRMCKLNQPCNKVHIHRGHNEKFYHWNLLPLRLLEQEQQLSKRRETEFGNGQCKIAPATEFNKFREININIPFHVIQEVTSLSIDPMQSIKIENVEDDGSPTQNKGSEELKKIKPFSTIIWINEDKKCNTQNGCGISNALKELSQMRRLKIGYHRGSNKTIWLRENGRQEYSSYPWDKDYPDDPPLKPETFFEKHKTTIIVVSVLVGVAAIVGVGICVQKNKKKGNATENSNNYRTQTVYDI